MPEAMKIAKDYSAVLETCVLTFIDETLIHASGKSESVCLEVYNMAPKLASWPTM